MAEKEDHVEEVEEEVEEVRSRTPGCTPPDWWFEEEEEVGVLSSTEPEWWFENAATPKSPQLTAAQVEELQQVFLLTERQVLRRKEAFALYDKDGDGTIRADQIWLVLRALGKYPSEAELQKMVNSVVGEDGWAQYPEGRMEFPEFLLLMTELPDTEEELIEAEPQAEEEEPVFVWVRPDGERYDVHDQDDELHEDPDQDDEHGVDDQDDERHDEDGGVDQDDGVHNDQDDGVEQDDEHHNQPHGMKRKFGEP